MRNVIQTLALVSAGILGALVGGGIEQHNAKELDQAATSKIAAFEMYDYDGCNYIVSDISKGPNVFKSITRTPGGNWCFRER